MQIEENDFIEHLNVVSFSESIEHMVLDGGYNSYIEAIVKFCDEHSIEFDQVPKFIAPALKAKLELEGVELGHLKKMDSPAWEF